MSWLVIACLKNAILALPLAAAALAVGRFSRRPALAHVLWVLVLVKLITPPLVDVPVGWQVDVETWLASDREIAPPALLVSTAAPATRDVETAVSTETIASADSDRASRAASSASSWSPLALQQVRQMVRAASTWLESPSWTVVLWLAGGIWLLGSATTAWLLFLRASRFHKYLRLACRDDDRLTSRVRQLSYRTGLISYPKVVVVEGVVSPMLWGIGSGVRLLFPARLTERLDAAETDALLLHELAHYSRGDYWVRLLELVTYVAYWWNPIVWWACRQIESSEEQCCDAWVVEHQSGTRRSYAEALLATIEFLNEPAEVRPPAACGLGEVSLLKLRLTQIMRGELAAQLPRTAWIVVLLAGLALAPLEPALFATSSRTPLAATPVAAVSDSALVHSLDLSPSDIAPLIAAQSPPAAAKASKGPAVSPPVASLPPLPEVLRPSRLYASVVSPNGHYELQARTGRKTVLLNKGGAGWPVNLESHEINCVSFSPDSRFFITGHKDGKIRQWDSETGGLMATIAGNAGAILSVAYSPDGRQFSAGSDDGVVTVWEAAGQQEVARRATPGAISCVRWSPRGDRLAITLGAWSQRDDSRLHIWDPREPVLMSDEALPQPAGAIDWLSDDVVLVAAWDGQGIVRNIRGGRQPEQTHPIEKELVSSANWSSDVRLVQSWVAVRLVAGAGL